MLPILLLTGLAAAAPAPAGCAAGLRAEIDVSSFASRDDGPPPTAAQLQRLRASAETAFRNAADWLCADGKLGREAIAGFKRLVIQSGSGATETAVYADPERPDALVFQWVFVEEKLALPDQGDIETGIACWADPDAEPCADRTP